jgi:hypothetical protein
MVLEAKGDFNKVNNRRFAGGWISAVLDTSLLMNIFDLPVQIRSVS